MTIPANEMANGDFSIDISNDLHLLDTARLLHKTLVLYTDLARPVFRQAVETILGFSDLHAQTYILIFNTCAGDLTIPDAIERRCTDCTMMQKTIMDLLQKSPGNVKCTIRIFLVLYRRHMSVVYFKLLRKFVHLQV